MLAALLPLVLCASLLADENPWIIMRVRDLTVQEVVDAITSNTDIDVEIEEAFAGCHVDLDLEDPAVRAIDRLADAAGAYLWKLGEGRYAIRRKAPPPASVPPPEELEGTLDDDDGEEPLPEPEWAKAINEALEKTPFTQHFRREPLPRVVEALAKAAGVPVYVDPALTRGKREKDLEIDEFYDVLGDMTIADAFIMLQGFHGILDIPCWGVLLVTTHKRFRSFPENVFLEVEEGKPQPVPPVFPAHRVNVKLKKASLVSAVGQLTKGSNLEIRVDRAAVKHIRKRRFTTTFADLALDDALALLLVPEGLALKAVEGGWEVVVR